MATQNAGSVEDDPKFIDINGVDNVFGGPDTALGGGADDNFTPGKFSPAIDAANALVQSPVDLLGQARRDDPAVANTGTGQPVYDESATGPNCNSDRNAGVGLPVHRRLLCGLYAAVCVQFLRHQLLDDLSHSLRRAFLRPGACPERLPGRIAKSGNPCSRLR